MAQLRSESFSVSAEFLRHQIILEAIPTTIARRSAARFAQRPYSCSRSSFGRVASTCASAGLAATLTASMPHTFDIAELRRAGHFRKRPTTPSGESPRWQKYEATQRGTEALA